MIGNAMLRQSSLSHIAVGSLWIIAAFVAGPDIADANPLEQGQIVRIDTRKDYHCHNKPRHVVCFKIDPDDRKERSNVCGWIFRTYPCNRKAAGSGLLDIDRRAREL